MSWISSIKFFHFNQVCRDQWIQDSANLVPAGSKILDIGAGSCPYRSLFSHCEYKTQDLKPLDKNQLRNDGYGEIDYICEATAIPVESGTFDFVLCTEMLEHVSEPLLVLKEISRILKKGGTLILTAPLGSGLHQQPWHFYGGYTPFFYEKFLSEYGFSRISIQANGYFYSFYGQESIRFLQKTSIFGECPLWFRILFTPFWLNMFFYVFIYLFFTSFLDRLDSEKNFTVGYFVTAKKTTD